MVRTIHGTEQITLDGCSKFAEVVVYQEAAGFGASSSLPLLIEREGKLVWSGEEKPSLFSARFDSKQCRDRFQQPQYRCKWWHIF